jgi:hypothetical protein
VIGFDRPIRPRWIYETLLLAEPGQKLSDLNKPFESIARELTGKEGKRKVRTVLFRYFLRSEESKAKVKNDLFLKDLSLEYGYDFMVPIYLFYLIGKSGVLYKVSEHLFRLYSFDSYINVSFLKEKIIDSYGDRDVVSRFVRSFLKTLEYFNMTTESDNKYFLKNPLRVTEDQFRLMLDIYGKDIINSPQIPLDDLPTPIFSYFDLPDLKMVARKYNGKDWEYQQRVGSDFIVFH